MNTSPVTPPTAIPGSRPAAVPPDADEAAQARPGYGIPSQDPRAGAQSPLPAHEAVREEQSVYAGGGMVAGAAVGAAIGVAVAGPVGVVVGGTVGAVAGAMGGAAAGAKSSAETAIPAKPASHRSEPGT